MTVSTRAMYSAVNCFTGVHLWSTCASEPEIQQANENLRMAGHPARFYKEGAFNQISLHAPNG